MSTGDFMAEIAWRPTETSGHKTDKFRRYISKKYGISLNSYWDLHAWSVENLSEFWKEIWDTFGVVHSVPYITVLQQDANDPWSSKWFVGAKLNIAENLLRFRDEHVAIYVTGEDRESERISYAQLYREACKYGAALRSLGLKKNDRVACYMHNRAEAIFAMLGTTSIGAIWTGALPFYGSKAVLNRFRESNPIFLFTTDRFLLNGEETHLLNNIKEIAYGLPGLRKVIIVPSKPESVLKDISQIPNSCFIEDFLAHGQYPDGSVPDLEFEQLPFDHPVFINYTSGTTGNPKALVHGIGPMLAAARDFGIHNSDTRDSVWISRCPVGWTAWFISMHLLFLGGTIVLYDGLPYFRYPTALWDIIDEFKITCLLCTPGILDELEKRHHLPGKHNTLTSLRTIVCSSTVVKLRNYKFIYDHVKKDVLFGSYYGASEHLGFVAVSDGSIPIYIGEISTTSFGIEFAVLNDENKPVIGKLGELVITTPAPSQVLYFWNDSDGKLYKENYLNKCPGYFAIGDFAYINPITKGICVSSRSCDTLKQEGCRFGSAEIYNIINTFPEVTNSLCVSQYNKDKDERAMLFLIMREGCVLTEELITRIKTAIEKELSKPHVPKIVLKAPDIPRNMNGKKMEIIVKKIINQMPCNTENVTNSECLQFYETIPELFPY